MQTYRITSRKFVAAAITNGGVVLEAAPVLKQFVGLELNQLLEYATRAQWSIEPLQPQSLSDWVHADGDLYEIKWNASRTKINRISLHLENGEVEDKAYNELPMLVKQAVL